MLDIFIWIVVGIVAVSGLLGYRYWIKREKESVNEEDKSIQDKEKAETILTAGLSTEVQPVADSVEPVDCGARIEWIELPHNLYFDEKRGDLRYGEELTIRLKDNPLRLFRCFIEVEQFKLTFKEICIEVLGRSVKDEIEKGDKAVVSNVARGLREALAPFPFIQIEAIRAVGYRMIIDQPDLSAEKQSISDMGMEQTGQE